MHLGDKVFDQTTDFSSSTDSCSPSHPTKVSNLTEPTKLRMLAVAETTTAAFEKEERSYQRVKEFNAEKQARKRERDAKLATSSKCFEEKLALSSATVPAHKPFTEHMVNIGGEIISEATPLELMIMANDIIPQAHAEIEVRDTG